MKDQRFTVQAVYDALLVKIDDANQFRDSDDQLPEPKRSGVYEAIAKLDDYEVIEARFGKKIADEKYRAVLQGPRPTRPLERVECDHTILDLFVIDPMIMLPIGRAYLTWMMCVFYEDGSWVLYQLQPSKLSDSHGMLEACDPIKNLPQEKISQYQKRLESLRHSRNAGC